MPNGITKLCTNCDTDLPISSFYNNAAAADGKQYHCKTCCKGANKSTLSNHYNLNFLIQNPTKLTEIIKKMSDEIAQEETTVFLLKGSLHEKRKKYKALIRFSDSLKTAEKAQ